MLPTLASNDAAYILLANPVSRSQNVLWFRAGANRNYILIYEFCPRDRRATYE